MSKSIAYLSVQDQRVDLDARIMELLNEVNLLRRQRNNLAPIAVLPPELLSRVFLYARDLVVGPEPFDFARAHVGLLLKVITRVCSHWRTTALGCADLWTIISDYGPGFDAAWVSNVLQRAAAAPLSISITAGVNTNFVKRELIPRLDHTRCLSLHLPGYVQSDEETSLLACTPAPCLAALELWETPGRLLNSLFANQMPPLRILHLNMVNKTPWDAQLLRCSTITDLDLTNTRRDDNRPRPDQLANVLSNLPLLLRLNLTYSCPDIEYTDSGPYPEPQRARLTHLRILRIEDHAQHISMGLRSIDMGAWRRQSPPMICIGAPFDWIWRLDTYIQNLRALNDSIGCLHTSFSSSITDSSGGHRVGRHVSSRVHIFDRKTPRPYWGIQFWPQSLRYNGSKSKLSPETAPWLEIQIHCPDVNNPATLTAFLQLHPPFFDTAAELSIRLSEARASPLSQGASNADITNFVREWSGILQSFPSARQVCLVGNQDVDLTTALVSSGEVNAEDESSVTTCLEGMTDLELRDSRLNVGPRAWLDWLQKRAKSDIGLKKLWLVNCSWESSLDFSNEEEKEVREAIQAQVEDVKWEVRRWS